MKNYMKATIWGTAIGVVLSTYLIIFDGDANEFIIENPWKMRWRLDEMEMVRESLGGS